ncbi:tyrosine-type recombinase/integrase [Microvirga arabica]|uniref:Tyrosine-type recombinase/integrase n=1 Tax=Microvirga arabica TaxID=1128671 RepID=A0ABV6Y725_9HYPH
MADDFSRESVTGVARMARWFHPLPMPRSGHPLVNLTVPTRYLFPSVLGEEETVLDSSRTREIIGVWCNRNEIRDKTGKLYHFGWHAFRHFYGTELALAGYDIHLIQMELGHASADMSIVYVNQRLRLRKKALLEKGGGQFVTIRGEVDDKITELAMRKDATLTVDVPGGLCSLPGQIGEWCEHNGACFTCRYFRADMDQLPFFERKRRSMASTLRRLQAEVAAFEEKGQVRIAEIGRIRIGRTECEPAPNADPQTDCYQMHESAGEFIASAGSSSAPGMTPTSCDFDH